jgi:putative ABC transport system permease protein
MKLRWLRTIRLGWRNLFRHKLRSGLAALGIIFGVCSVIAMLAIGEGASHEAQQQIKKLGATSIIVRSVRPSGESAGNVLDARVLHYGLSDADFEQLRTTVPTVAELLPVHEMAKEIRAGSRTLDGRAVATTAAYERCNQLRMYRGRFLSELDLKRFDNVAVLAYEVAQALFPLDDPIGRNVRIHTDYFRVIGVCQPRSGAAAIGGGLAAQDYQRDVYLPLTTARLRFGTIHADQRGSGQSYERTQWTQFTLTVGSTEEVRPTAVVVRDLLARSHRQHDYGVTVPLELLEQAERTKRLFNVVLGSVGAISLLVGGIGIMNIMLATVTERTREIGIRRALGARRADITAQFLVEAVVLSSVGGLLGLTLGVGLAYLVEQAAMWLGMPLEGSATLFHVPVKTRWLVAAGIGLLSGAMVLAVFIRLLIVRGPRLLLILGAPVACLAGSALGMLFGVGLPYMITDLVHYFFDFPVPTIINTWSLPLAFGISVLTGVVFGLYPARRAALMDPIEALRHD